MAPHSSTLAWRIPWMEEPGRLQSMGSLRVGHDSATSLSLFTFMHWRRKWQPTPVFLPGESQGQRNLLGCRLWNCTESDTTDVTAEAAAAAGGSDGNVSAYSVGALGSIPGSGRSSREGNGNSLPYSCLEIPIFGGAWQSTVHDVPKTCTWLSA